jgi:DNA (cytosine-5)-methyltransferase 1
MTTQEKRSAVSLFSGAGGMDVGFARAGFETAYVCEIDRDACDTLNANLDLIGHRGNRIEPQSVTDVDLSGRLPTDLDVIFGGPPCQGFSVAGKMDPDDDRSKLIHAYFDLVDEHKPKAFVCENVKALGVAARWANVRAALLKRASKHYRAELIVLNASEFGVPQIRERMFLIGVRKDLLPGTQTVFKKRLLDEISGHKRHAETVGDIVRRFGPAGTENNPRTCAAKISYAKSPVLRKSPYAGMMFNGAGRPLSPNGWATTLPASMGGNKTPIVDEAEIFQQEPSFIEAYHKRLMDGGKPLKSPLPRRLRRLTIRECMAIQTFPDDFVFSGSKSSVYRQIGNAVPCDLAEAVAKSVAAILDKISLPEAARLLRVA